MHLPLLLTAALLGTAVQDPPLNDPASCPYCENDPERMLASGVVSHGGFEFGEVDNDTRTIDQLLATSDIRWIESAHFELGFALGSYKLKDGERKSMRAELEELQLVLPEVNPKTKILDPWLRAHLYVQRMEKVYARFQQLMGVTDADFPDGTKPWNLVGKYMGEGPYLGQKGKYEVLLLPSEASSVMFLRDQFGLLIRLTQRWNVIPRDTLILIAHMGQGDLKTDGAMYGHVAFNLTINMFDGYKHYSYESPIWLREGLAHFVEREINPEFNTFDSSEGAVAEMTRKSNWEPEVRKLISRDKQLRMSQLVVMKSYAELTLEHHYTTWSMVDYLVREMPEKLMCFTDGIKGIVNEDGFADGSNLLDHHRDAFGECFGMSYLEFDKAWTEWVMATYSAK